MTAWNHQRKGRIVGNIVGDPPADSEWIRIELTEDGWAYAGEVIDVRRSFLRELAE